MQAMMMTNRTVDTMNAAAARWDWIRRINHALLAVSVVFQVFSSEWMTKPWREGPADTTGRLLFTLHEWAGLVAAIAAAAIFWRLLRRKELPRTDAAGRTALCAECRTLLLNLVSLRMPHADSTATLARAVQVLGLLLTGWFVATGAAIWLVGAATETAHTIGGIHELGAPLLYAYLGGHIGMAVLHRLSDRG
ncbi:MAG TPA: cytochrome b/b6 domain-containing protein [Methyloversatilis sp.]